MAIQIKNPTELQNLATTFGLGDADFRRESTGEVYLSDNSALNRAVADFSNLSGRSPQLSNATDLNSIKDLMNPKKASSNVSNNLTAMGAIPTTPEGLKAGIVDKTKEVTEANKAGGSGLSILQGAIQNKIKTKETKKTGFGLSQLYEQAGLNVGYSTLSNSLKTRQNEITGDINNLRNVLSDIGSIYSSKAESLTGELDILKFNLEETQRQEDLISNNALSIASGMLQSGEKIPDGVLSLLNPELRKAFEDAGVVMNTSKKRDWISERASDLYDSDFNIKTTAEALEIATQEWNKREKEGDIALLEGKLIKLSDGSIYNDSTYAIDPKHTATVASIYNTLNTYGNDVVMPEEEKVKVDSYWNKDGNTSEFIGAKKLPAIKEAIAIDNYLKDRNIDSTYNGRQIVNVASEYGIDPYLFQSMLQAESGSGTSYISKTDNNPGGVTWSSTYEASHDNVSKGSPRPADEGGNYVRFENIEDGLGAVAQQIQRRMIQEPTEQDFEKVADDFEIENEMDENIIENTADGISFDESQFSDLSWDVFEGYRDTVGLSKRDKGMVNSEVAEIKRMYAESDNFSDNLKSTSGGGRLSSGDSEKLVDSQMAASMMNSLSEHIAEEDTGPLAGAIKNANLWDSNAQLIKSEINSLMPKVARGLYGEVGVLTDTDIARYEKTIGNLSKTEKANALITLSFYDKLMTGFTLNLENYMNNGKDVSKYIDAYENLKQQTEAVYEKYGMEYKTDEQSSEDESDLDAELENL